MPANPDSSDPLRRALETARRDLLDLGLRNPLLNHRVLRGKGLEILDEDPAQVFDVLVREEKRMTFLSAAAPPAEGADAGLLEQPEPDPGRHSDLQLQTPYTSAQLQTRLLYIRPTNGRAEDQLRRNHSTQYISFPDWPWERTRRETPGLYESYVDLQPAVWTHLRIVVAGSKARLYVNGAEQPCLIVNDLKLAPASGSIGLWIGPGSDGYFANLRVTQ